MIVIYIICGKVYCKIEYVSSSCETPEIISVIDIVRYARVRTCVHMQSVFKTVELICIFS